MTLWVVLAAMTGAAVMSVLWPLSRRVGAASQGNSDLRFYRDQMDEIVRDEERGLLTGAEIASARAEAGRRLLRSGTADPQAGSGAGSTGEPALRRRRAASAIALSVVPLVTLAIYGALGSPGLPALPVALRASGETGRLDLAAAVARVEQHLAAQPDDARGWDVIAPIYLRSQRFAEAEKAFAASIRLGGASLERLTGRGEALVGAGGGLVTREAREIFDAALALDAGNATAQFYLGIAAEQDGDAAKAVRHFQTLVAGAPPDAPWLPIVRGKLAALGAPSEDTAPLSLAGKAVPPEIRAMVEGLDARLGAQGGSVEEWVRLIRSYAVLGERDKAQASLSRALGAVAGADGGAAALAEAARGLGLHPEEPRR